MRTSEITEIVRLRSRLIKRLETPCRKTNNVKRPSAIIVTVADFLGSLAIKWHLDPNFPFPLLLDKTQLNSLLKKCP